MKFRAIDVETTGLPAEDEDAAPSGIMEIGWVDWDDTWPTIPDAQGQLVDCGIPVTIEARAVHHISDAMVVGEMTPTEACAQLAAGDHQYLVAHNIDHEKHYVGAGMNGDQDRQWLCSYKTALRLWPESPGHKLHELRYFLDLDSRTDFDPRKTDHPHRAADDAYVCMHLLRRILEDSAKQDIDIDRLAKWSSGPALLVMCWMKKHKGKTWAAVAREDREYLVWIYEKSDVKDRDILATVKYWLKQTAK